MLRFRPGLSEQNLLYAVQRTIPGLGQSTLSAQSQWPGPSWLAGLNSRPGGQENRKLANPLPV